MDFSIEITTPSGSITTPRGSNDIAQYFTGITVDEVPDGALQWSEADHHHGFNYFNAPSLDTSWTEEDASKYVDANHPMVMDDRELDLLSDHSHSTTTDSDSHGSSNAYSTGSLPSNGHTDYSHHDSDWQHFSATYGPHGQPQLLPCMASTTSPYGMDHDNISNPFLMHPSSDVLSPTIDPATFHHTIASPALSVGKVRAHPHPDSPSVSGTLVERPCISLSDLSAPYIPDTQQSIDGDLELPASEEDVPLPPSHKRFRSIGRDGSEECDCSVVPSRLPAKAPLNPAGHIRGPRRRAPSFTSSSSSELSDSPPSPKRTRRASQKVKEEYDRFDEDGDVVESDVTDSDIYSPSSSPSVDATHSDYSESISHSLTRGPRKLNRKNILKMSAADALAQLSGSTSSAMSYDLDGEWEPADAMGLTSSSRRNQSIPIPVPVPHLTKKSRGRKVPYVNTRVARGLPFEDPTYDGDDDSNGRRGGSGRQGRGRGGGRSGGRSFVCTVEGCGKCFIRGEHLKRHVRSIHTNDKPHVCPYPGCGKSFSRRDNLGQHVRLHLAGNA